MSFEYNDQLSSGEWQKKRLRIFERDKFCCTICGSDKKIQVHHIDYIPGIKAWQYPDDMLKTLCDFHHKAENPRERMEKWLANSLRMKGFMVGDIMALATRIDVDVEFTQALLKSIREYGS